MNVPLQGAGFVHHELLRTDGDHDIWDEFLDMSVEFGCNLTAFTWYDDDGKFQPRGRSQELADLIAERAAEFHERTGGAVVVYLESVWANGGPDTNGWENTLTLRNGRLKPEHENWVKRVTRTTKGIPIIWSPCLEPREVNRWWCTVMLRAIRRYDPSERPTLFNSNDTNPAPLATYYESGVKREAGNNVKVSLTNGDHWGKWLTARRSSTQQERIREVPSDQAILMITDLFGHGMHSWDARTKPPNWSSDGTWRVMGEEAQLRAGSVIVPEEPTRPKEAEWRRQARVFWQLSETVKVSDGSPTQFL